MNNRIFPGFVGAVTLLAALSSCSPKVQLRFEAGSPALKAELVRLASVYSRAKGAAVALADKAASPNATTLVVGWSLLPAAGDPLPRGGYATAAAFERWARDGKAFREVPLLWDAWGIAASPERLAPLGSGKTFAWKDRGALGKARVPFLTAGGEPGVRQALFWSSWKDLPAQGELAGIESGGAERTAPASRASFKSFAAIGKDPILDHNAFHFKLADADNFARNSPASPLFGSYSWQRSVPGTGRRDFRALVYPLPQGYAMPVSMLCGRVTGTGASAAKARDFLSWLLSPENQKALSEATGYMAVNFNAANLDPNALAARDAALGAALAVPIDPEPLPGSTALSWDSLLAKVLAAPSEWERILSDKEYR